MIVNFFDCETTGLIRAGDLNPPRIIDIGLVTVDTSAPNNIQRWGTLVNPGIPVPEKITALTGITTQQLKLQPTFADILPALRQRLACADAFVSHNAYFDVNMLLIEAHHIGTSILFPDKVICTVDETYSILGHKLSLPELWAYAVGTPYKEKHRAITDAEDLSVICSALKIPVEAYENER